MPIKRIDEFPDGSGLLTADDIFLFMDDPANVGVSKKITLNQLAGVLGNISTSGNYIITNTSAVPGSSGIYNIVQLSQSAYDQLGTIDPHTLYIIK